MSQQDKEKTREVLLSDGRLVFIVRENKNIHLIDRASLNKTVY